jgi:hypothetical protein
MLRNTHLYENRMFTNEGNLSIIWGGKEKERVPLIKNLIDARVWKRCLRGALLDLKRIGLCNRKVVADMRTRVEREKMDTKKKFVPT